MWSLQFAASNIWGKCSSTSVQRLSAGCGLGLLLSPPSPLTLTFCWPGCAVHMCLLGIFALWDGGFIPCASSQALVCGLVLIWGTKLGSWESQLGTSCCGVQPCTGWWVVQDLPSRWYENADGNQRVPYNGHEGNMGISVLFKILI